MVHRLKTWPWYFQEVAAGRKNFEVRRCDDRDFKVGDTLILLEYDPRLSKFTGNMVSRKVTYILYGKDFAAINKKFCVMSLKEMESENE